MVLLISCPMGLLLLAPFGHSPFIWFVPGHGGFRVAVRGRTLIAATDPCYLRGP